MKTIIDCIEELWFELKMEWCLRFAVRIHGYSETFDKDGYWLDDTNWFVPLDGSFKYGYAPK